MDVKKIVARNIKFIRKELGYTQEEFADEVGVSRASVGSYEEARALPSVEKLIVIADLHGITLDELIRRPITKF